MQHDVGKWYSSVDDKMIIEYGTFNGMRIGKRKNYWEGSCPIATFATTNFI
jgi:hypothetical protein